MERSITLGEKALAIFLQHYYDLDWIRYFIVRKAAVKKITSARSLMWILMLQVEKGVFAKELKLIQDWINNAPFRMWGSRENIENNVKEQSQQAMLLSHILNLAKEAKKNGYTNQASLWISLLKSIESVKLTHTSISLFLQLKLEQAKDRQDPPQIQRFWNETLQLWQTHSFRWIEQTINEVHFPSIISEIQGRSKITYTIEWMKFAESTGSQALLKGDAIARSHWLSLAPSLGRLIRGVGHVWEIQLLRALVCRERGERPDSIFQRLWLAAADELLAKVEEIKVSNAVKDRTSIHKRFNQDTTKENLLQDDFSYNSEEEEVFVQRNILPRRHVESDEDDEETTEKVELETATSAFIDCLDYAETALKTVKFISSRNMWETEDSLQKPLPSTSNPKFYQMYNRFKRLFADSYEDLVYLLLVGMDSTTLTSSPPTSILEAMQESYNDDGYDRLRTAFYSYEKSLPKEDPTSWIIQLDQLFATYHEILANHQTRLLSLFEERLIEFEKLWQEYCQVLKDKVVEEHRTYGYFSGYHREESKRDQEIEWILRQQNNFARECFLLVKSLQSIDNLEPPEQRPKMIQLSWELIKRLISLYPVKVPSKESKEYEFNRVLALVVKAGTVEFWVYSQEEQEEKQKQAEFAKKVFEMIPVCNLQFHITDETNADSHDKRTDKLKEKAWIAAASLLKYLDPVSRGCRLYRKLEMNNHEIFPAFMTCIDLVDQNPKLATLYYEFGHSRMLAEKFPKQDTYSPIYSAFQKAITYYETGNYEASEMERCFGALGKLLEQKDENGLAEPVRENYTQLKNLKEKIEKKEEKEEGKRMQKEMDEKVNEEKKDAKPSPRKEWTEIAVIAIEHASSFSNNSDDHDVEKGLMKYWQRLVNYLKANKCKPRQHLL